MNLANNITITRIILTPFFIAAVVYSRLDLALGIFAVAVISDGLDGFIARSMNQKTQLGTILDPIADKLLLVSAFICLTFVRNMPEDIKLPAYVLIIVMSRDAIIVIGSIVVYLMKGDLKVSPSGLGKLTTFFQMMTIVSVLVQFRYSHLVWSAAVSFTIASGIDYMLKGSKLLNGSHVLKG